MTLGAGVARRLTLPLVGLCVAVTVRSADVPSILRLAREGRVAEAEAAARELLASLAANGQGESLEAARATDALVANLHAGGKAASAEAEAAARRAVTLKERCLGAAHREVASSLNNLAMVLKEAGEEAAALPELRRAREIWGAADGEQSIIVARAENNIAGLLQALGDLPAAREGYERALGILERQPADEAVEARRERRLQQAGALNNLAMLLVDLGEAAQGEARATRALSLWRETLPAGHPAIATGLNNLGWCRQASDNLPGAKALYAEARTARETALGAEHPFTLGTIENLGDVAAALGDTAEARALHQRVLDARQRTHGASHPLVARSLRLLAEAEAREGAIPGAVGHALAAEEVARSHFRASAGHLAEREALLLQGARRLASVRSAGLDLAVSLAPRVEPEMVARVWDGLIRSRALVLDEVAARLRARERGDAETTQLLEELSQASARYSRLLVRTASEEASPAQLAALDEARRRREDVERRLAARRREPGTLREETNPGLREVAAALPPDAALVAFARHGGPGGGDVAFVLGAERDRPRAVDLGPAAETEDLVARWRLEAARGTFDGSRDAARAEAACNEVGAALRLRVWDPVAAHLGAARRVVVVPDGALHLVHWGALPAAGGGYLVEGPQRIELLSAERDLVPVAGEAPRGAGILVVGAPDFGAAGAGAGPAWRRFEPLPAAAREAEEIAAAWRSYGQPADLLRGAAATEAAFRERAAGRFAIHLATHGFFLRAGEALPTDAANGLRGIGGLKRMDRAPPARLRSPLALAGLALAGASGAAPAAAGAHDGVLLAEEVACLDLAGVELVVLSACDTGAGEVLPGEGILGLRRAFQAAGARSLVLSLWPVDDRAAREWMGVFHGALLERALPAAAASHDAARTILARRRAAGESTHPFFWGAFVAAGVRR